MYSPADSNHSSSSGVSSDPRYIKANSSANNVNNSSNSPPYETNASLASHGKFKKIYILEIVYLLKYT